MEATVATIVNGIGTKDPAMLIEQHAMDSVTDRKGKQKARLNPK
jgi:hypothetical protein